MISMSAELWNEFYLIGTLVLLEPTRGRGNYERRLTTSEAWTARSGMVLVKLSGSAGGCSVDHMAPIVIAAKAAPEAA